MKKVLILSVIAMLALGVMTMAAGWLTSGGYSSGGTGPYGEKINLVYNGYITEASTGPTQNTGKLQVTSIIGVEQGYVATAVSYNASFCGVSGNPLTGLQNSSNGMLLAQLFIESNATDVTLIVSASTTLPSSALTFTYGSLSNTTWGNSGKLTLSTTNVLGSPTFNTLGSYSGSSPEKLNVTQIGQYTGTAQVYANANSSNWSSTKWVTAGQYTVNITFTIDPDYENF
jgi:hypothetical protein